MKLVDYLRALLSQFVSKKDTGFIAEQSRPSSVVSRHTVPPTSGSGAHHLLMVAPCNGYACLNFSGTQGSWGGYYLEADGEIATKMHGGAPFAREITKAVRCVKGGNVQTHVFSESGTATLIFYSRVGGGSNPILNPILRSIQGGLLCLRNTCKLYLKRLSVVRKSGSAINRCQVIDWIWTKVLRATLHLAMESYSLITQTIQVLKTSSSATTANTLRERQLHLHQQTLLALGSICQKGRPQRYIRQLLLVSCGFPLTKAHVNPSFGGALC